MARPFADHSGKKIGAWLVLDFYGRAKHNKPIWNCLCECGTRKPVIIGTILQGRSQSCGCKSEIKAAKFAATIASRVPYTTTFECEFCGVELTRYKKEVESSLSQHGRLACKSCATIEKNKSDAKPVGSTRLHKQSGYVEVKTECGWKRQHIAVIEAHIGRSLSECEVVHHENHIKTDNRLENLVLMVNSDHTVLHHLGSKRSQNQVENIKNGIRSSATAKLSMEAAKLIRAESQSGLSLSVLADRYGVSVATIGRVVRNESWT